MSQQQGQYKTRSRRRTKAFNPASIYPKKCEIVETMTGQRPYAALDSFPSRNLAKKALAKIIDTLPKRTSPDEVDKYYIRNV